MGEGVWSRIGHGEHGAWSRPYNIGVLGAVLWWLDRVGV